MAIVKEFYQLSETPKLFGKWDYNEVQNIDVALENYIAIRETKSQVYVPHTAGRYQIKHLKKATMPIVERLVGGLLFHGRNAGKKLKALNIVQQAFEIIHLQTGENPIQVLIQAIANSSPREDSTRIGKGGNVKRQAVDVSSFRRINQGVYFLTSYARKKAFKNTKNIAECLADEIILAGTNNANSQTIKKRDEIERGAKTNR